MRDILLIRKVPKSVMILITCSVLWQPFIHLLRWIFAPNGYLYSGIEGVDISVFVWTLDSPLLGYKSLRDLEIDVNIFQRADHMANIFLPYGWIGHKIGLPSVMIYVLLTSIFNGLCAYITYHFFRSFLDDERIATTATFLSYLGSGISGVLVGFKWLYTIANTGSVPSLQILLSGWLGENHAISHEFADGNALITITSMSRVHYLLPRCLGLFSLIWIYEIIKHYDISRLRTTKLLSTTLFMFLATFFHPASGLIYVFMHSVLITVCIIINNKSTNPIPNKSVWKVCFYPFFGFALGAIYWQIYRQDAQAKDMIELYLTTLYNTDALTLILGVMPMLSAIFIMIWIKTKKHKQLSLILFAIFLGIVGSSEYFITESQIIIRALLLLSSALILIWLTLKNSNQIFLTISEKRNFPVVVMLLWFVGCSLISVSPHHDIRKVIYSNFSESEYLKKISDLGNFIFAARFKLGVFLPLSGLCAILLYRYYHKNAKLIFISILIISLPSISIYFLTTLNHGYIRKSDAAAMKFLENKQKSNVMCSSLSGIYLPSISKKRAFSGSAADPNYRIHSSDVLSFFQSNDERVRHDIELKYRIDYVYLGESEKKIGGKIENFVSYKKIYDSSGVQIFMVQDSTNSN